MAKALDVLGEEQHNSSNSKATYNSKMVKFADCFEIRHAFELTEKYRTERFKDFTINHIDIKTLLYGPF
ncbi:hypothetical protein [Bartonella sp. CM120XJJH]|uniref:hypothetical protein n=1 Tax=Bartonella sp. CM120XJJH TaxID=3243544 RepID=UPI0035D07AB9